MIICRLFYLTEHTKLFNVEISGRFVAEILIPNSTFEFFKTQEAYTGKRLDMHEQKLKQYFDKYINEPIEVWKSIMDLFTEVKFKKNKIIKTAGQVENNAYFILNGACGVFLWKETNFVCLDIILENSFFADHMSLITGQPTQLETVALENTTALQIGRENIARLKNSIFGSTIFLLGTENSFVVKQKQQIDLLTKTAEQRYDELMNKNPELIQRMAQKHIASYLGITTQSLSRIRNR